MEQELLRKVQLVQLEIAQEIKRVCQENGIRFWLDFGSALGAVRHGGFIPWDDDLDMGMLREDYEKFLQVASSQLDPRYVLMCWQTEERYPHQYAKVMKRGTVYRESVYHGTAFAGIFVDIFPYDRMPDDPAQRRQTGSKLAVYRAMIRAKCGYKTWRAGGAFSAKRWLKNLPFRFLSLFFNLRSLREKSDRLACRYNGCQELSICTPQGVFAYGVEQAPRRYLEHLTQISFEGELFPVPEDYDGYLTCLYGDYMCPPPEEERVGQHSVVEVDLGDGEEIWRQTEL